MKALSKITLSSLFVAVVIVGMAGCVRPLKAPGQQGARPTSGKITLRILSTNDIHGALSPTLVSEPVGPGRLGGVENLAGMIDKLRAEAPDATLVVDAGDCFQGDYAVNASEGSFCTDYFNLAGYTVRTIGNHEFDYLDIGPDADMKDPRGALKRMLSTAAHPVVLANAHLPDGSAIHERLVEFTVLDVGGVKVGVTGVITPATPTVSRRAGSADLVFEQPVDALKRVLPRMRSAGADVVVVLSHLTGLCRDRRDLYSANEVPCVVGGELAEIQKAFTGADINLIVSGHDHVMLKGDGNAIPVLENLSQGIVVGRAEIDVDLSDGRKVAAVRVLDHVPVCIKDAPGPSVCAAEWPGFKGWAEPNAAVRDLRLSVEKAVAAECADIVASARTDITFFRGTEPPLANVAVDLLRELGRKTDGGKTVDADFAFMNRGSTRGSLSAGPVSVCEIARVWPFTDPAVLVMMTGAEIVKLMTFMVDEVQKAPVISGFRVVREGNGPLRILGADGVQIDDGRMYRVVTTKYLVEGGDRLDEFFRDFPRDRITDLPFPTYRDGFIQVLRARGTISVPDTNRYVGVTRE